MPQANLSDKRVFDHLKSEFRHFEQENQSVLKTVERQIRKELEYARDRVSDWQSVVVLCERQLDDEKRRDGYMAFIKCQRSGINRSKGRYPKGYVIHEKKISRMGKGQLLAEAQSRRELARKAADEVEKALHNYRRLAESHRVSIHEQVAKANGRLSKLRRQLERYAAEGMASVLATVVVGGLAHVVRSVVNGGGIDASSGSSIANVSSTPASGLNGNSQAEMASSRDLLRSLCKSVHQTDVDDHASTRIDLTAYPNLEFLPDGEIFGPYAELRRFLTDRSLAGTRAEGQITFEAHHLLEDRMMAHFDISHEEGLAVAIEATEHMGEVHGELGIDFHLPRSQPDQPIAYDIWDVVDGHINAYDELGLTAWSIRVRQYVSANHERILAAYQDGTVAWATTEDGERAKQYLKQFSI